MSSDGSHVAELSESKGFLRIYPTRTTAAAKALLDRDDMNAESIALKAMTIAAEICVYTNHNFVTEVGILSDDNIGGMQGSKSHIRVRTSFCALLTGGGFNKDQGSCISITLRGRMSIMRS